MSNDFGGRSSRTAPTSSMGSGVAIFVTAVALVLGFLILRKVNDTGPSVSGGTQTTATTPGTDVGVTDNLPTTTLLQTFTGTKVQVANSSSKSGVARMMTTALLGAGFTMADATNGTANPKLATSQVIYNASDPAAKAVANTLANTLRLGPATTMSLPLPVTSGSWSAGSGVILLLGDDLAGKTLESIQGAPTTGTTLPGGATTTSHA